mmetsp:Transcript_38885/g.81345  ORF Transcript_38885/g.81345 Transcript_38885/m.81345 type:complete len:225 (-) Transcript_38885:54-728(-)
MQNAPHNRPSYWLLILLLFGIKLIAAAAAMSTPQQMKLENLKYEAQKNNVRAVSQHDVLGPALTSTTNEVSFLPVVYISIFNSVVNILRPDPAIIWQARLPRVLWEICIAFVAKSVNCNQSSLCLLLCLMMVPTALVDIFIWAPSFAMFAEFESCKGGGFLSRQPKICVSDYAKGIGRLFVTVQSLFTGVFYLFTAVVAWTTYAEIRDSSIANKNAKAMANALQ